MVDSARSFTSKVEQSEDYGGYSDYEETTPSAPELYENMSRESTGKNIYDNMYS